jgi:hypothetical protein
VGIVTAFAGCISDKDSNKLIAGKVAWCRIDKCTGLLNGLPLTELEKGFEAES